MARPPRRSAFELARLEYKSVTLIKFSIILLIVSGNICVDGTSRNIDENNFSNQSQLQQPKFGDRLLPRHRQINSSTNNVNSINNHNKNLVIEMKNNSYSDDGDYENSAKNNSDNESNFNNNYQSLNSSYQYNLIKNHHKSNNNNNSNNYNYNNNNNSNNNNEIYNNSYQNKDNDLLISVVDDDNVVIPVKRRQHSQQHHLNRQGQLQADNVDFQEHTTIDKSIPSQSSSSSAAAATTLANQKVRRNDNDIDNIDHIDHHLNISKADRLIEMSTEFFVIPTMHPPPQHHLQPARNGGGQQQAPPPQNLHNNHHQPIITPRPVLILASRTTPPPQHSNILTAGGGTPPTIISTVNLTGLRKEPWVIPVLVLASLSMILMAAFEIFVLFKAWRTSPSRRHLFLGQMLLLGLFACSGLGAIITATPTVLSCATLRFGIGVAYALVFAALLVKCVFLISLNGGVYLPAPYQGLLLLFAVLIQCAIGIQWLMTQPPEIQHITIPYGSQLAGTNSNSHSNSHFGKFSMLITSADIAHRLHGTTLPLCKTHFSELLFSLVYIFFLIIFVAVLAIKSRGIRDNYREATYIGLAIGGAIPIWLGWTLCGLAVADRHKDACTAFGLVATSATVFLVMFMPKGRQLAAMGKEGLYVEDREEQFSSLSRAGSGYSPSFFHFKPIKYGVMGPVPNSATNGAVGGTGVIGNNSNSKHCPTLAGGALVTAAPLSYTRMYHYFPAHMAHPFCFYPTQLPPPPPPQLSPQLPQLKAIGSSLASSPAQIAKTLRYPGLFMRPDETNIYTTLEPTLSSNPNVFFQRSGAVHPGMMY